MSHPTLSPYILAVPLHFSTQKVGVKLGDCQYSGRFPHTKATAAKCISVIQHWLRLDNHSRYSQTVWMMMTMH